MHAHVDTDTGVGAKRRDRASDPLWLRPVHKLSASRGRLDKVDSHDVTEHPFGNQLDEDSIARHPEIVLGDFKVDTVFLAGVDDHIAAGEGRCHRFFDDGVHLMFRDNFRHFMMLIIAGADVYDIDILVFVQHLFDIGIVRQTVLLPGLARLGFIDIADGDEV